MQKIEPEKSASAAISWAVTAAVGMLSAGYASAQDAAAPATVLEEVSVSAKKEKPVQERTELGKLTEHTPVSGAVLDRAEVEHLMLQNNLLELAKRIPGISMIRNMRIPDGGKLYTENRIDGMRSTSTNTSLLDEVNNADIERIEVITGPASALYGSGAFGGTISVTTRQPPSAGREARLSQELGAWGFQRSQGNFGISTSDGRFGFLASGSTMDFDGWRLSPAPAARDAAAEHKDAATFKFRFRPVEGTTVVFGQGNVKYDFRWAGPLTMWKFGQDWRQTEAGTYGQYRDEYDSTTVRVEQNLGDRGTFTLAHGRLVDDQLNYGNGGSGGANNVICDDGGVLAAPLAAGTTVKCRAVNNNSAAVTNTIKPLRTVSRTTVAMYRHDFDTLKTTAYVGNEIIDVVSDSKTYANVYNALEAQSGAWGLGALTATGQGNRSVTRETTPFFHVEFSPIDDLRLHFGERFTRADFLVDDRTATNRDVAMTRSGNVVRAGATYELNRSHLVWASWGETFNPQSTGSLVNSAAVGTAGNVIGQVLSPERGKTQELGFRGRNTDLGLKYDATLFNAVTSGFIVARTCSAAESIAFNAGAACTINENSGELVTRGLESMMSWSAARWLDVGATYTNSTAYFSRFVSPTFDFTGKTYQAMPRHKVNLRLAVKPAPKWQVELEGDHISSYFVDNTNLLGTYKRPNLYTLRASYRSRDWSFWLHAVNLTNQKYATRVQLSTIAGVANVLSAQAGQGNAGSYTPLMIRAGVSYQF